MAARVQYLKFPKRLNIHGQSYSMRFAKANELPEGVAGVCHFHDKEIILAKDPHKGRLLATILHEIKHASQRESGLIQILDVQAIEFDAENFSSLITGLFDVKFKGGSK